VPSEPNVEYLKIGFLDRPGGGGAKETSMLRNTTQGFGLLRNTYNISVGKTKRKKPIGRARCIREDTIKINLQETRCKGEDWIFLDQDKVQWRALVYMVMNRRVL
jgi:hypothetical protein